LLEKHFLSPTEIIAILDDFPRASWWSAGAWKEGRDEGRRGERKRGKGARRE
jgi:hypothetical protein